MDTITDYGFSYEYDPDYHPELGAGEERDSYEQEEEQLLFAAWCAEVDAGEPPF